MGVWGLSFSILSIHGSFMFFIDVVNLCSAYSFKLISMLGENPRFSCGEPPDTLLITGLNHAITHQRVISSVPQL